MEVGLWLVDRLNSDVQVTIHLAGIVLDKSVFLNQITPGNVYNYFLFNWMT